MSFKAVMFDFGDTLVHTDGFNYDACLQKMHQSLTQNRIAVPFEDFKRAYFEVRDQFYKEMDKTLEEQDFAERVTKALRPFGFDLNAEDKRVKEAVAVFVDEFVESLVIDDYLPSLLKELHKKYKLAIVSNMSFAEAEFKALRKFGIDKYFNAVVVSRNVGWRKPSPKIFQQALKALNVKAEETVFVGDSPRADIEGAKQLGMKTILIDQKSRKLPSTDTFRLYVDKGVGTGNPDKTIAELSELPKTLDTLQNKPQR